MGEFLCRKRKEKNLTQQMVADEAGITKAHYSFIERGKRHPSPKIAKRIAKILDVDWTLFYKDDDDKVES